MKSEGRVRGQLPGFPRLKHSEDLLPNEVRSLSKGEGPRYASGEESVPQSRFLTKWATVASIASSS
jgi:hypothetical protein